VPYPHSIRPGKTISLQRWQWRTLGVRRGGITEAAGKLQKAGLIRYSRGHIAVLDRSQLEAQVCECYAVVKREDDRLLRAEYTRKHHWACTARFAGTVPVVEDPIQAELT